MPGDTSKGTVMEGKFMANRRKVLQGSAAAFATAPILSAAGSAAADDTPEAPAPVSLYKVIYDNRLAESMAFGDAAAARGLSVAAIAGDVTPLWYEDLDPRWRQGPVAVAGMTGHGPLFCLERLAWEKGMRVVFRVDHTPDADGRLTHRVRMPESLLPRTGALEGDGAQWPARMAELVAACPAAGEAKTTAQIETAAVTDAAAESLISWVIAPVGRTPLT